MLPQAPQEEAREIARGRFPVPKIIDCDQNGSQVTFALSRMTIEMLALSSCLDSSFMSFYLHHVPLLYRF